MTTIQENKVKPIQDVIIIGRGAVGITFGSIFQKALGSKHFRFAANEERVARYQQGNLVVNDQKDPFSYTSHPSDFQKADLILILTKAGGLEEAIEIAKEYTKEDSIILSGINGILSEERLYEEFGYGNVLRSIAQKMDALYANENAHFSTPGELVVGAEKEEQLEMLERLCTFFDSISFPYLRSENIIQDAWKKLMVNCALNQICAVYHATYGDIVSKPELKALLIEVMQEVKEVANAQSIALSDAMIDEWVASIETFDPESMPSMAQDALAKRKTEKELFSGTVVPLAHQYGIKVPQLEKLYEQLCALEKSYGK
jgi:2-dehydropantoate 2-reductase